MSRQPTLEELEAQRDACAAKVKEIEARIRKTRKARTQAGRTALGETVELIYAAMPQNKRAAFRKRVEEQPLPDRKKRLALATLDGIDAAQNATDGGA